MSSSVSGSIVQMLPDVHAFMQHTDDDNLTILKAVIGDVAVEVETAVTGAYLVAGLAKFGIFGELVKSQIQLFKIGIGLGCPPRIKRKLPNVGKISFRTRVENNVKHPDPRGDWRCG